MAVGTAAFFAALFKTNDPIHVNKINLITILITKGMLIKK